MICYERVVCALTVIVQYIGPPADRSTLLTLESGQTKPKIKVNFYRSPRWQTSSMLATTENVLL